MYVVNPHPPFFPQGIKLSADVKPFVPKFAGLSVAWSESSEARVFPGCAAAYYPCVQELPGPEYVSFSLSCPPRGLSGDCTSRWLHLTWPVFSERGCSSAKKGLRQCHNLTASNPENTNFSSPHSRLFWAKEVWRLPCIP